MLFWIIIRSSVQSLMANKLRSLLAMLGIIIGVGAVIAMLAMGAGAQAQVMASIQSMGTNLLVVRPAQRGTGGVMSGTEQDLTVEDAVALRSLPGVAAVSPSVGGSVQAKYMNKNARTQVTGGSVTYFQIRNFQVDQGRQFTEGEAEGLARVAVIGQVTAANLFGNDSPIGEQIKVNGIDFTIVGQLATKGDSGWNNPDDQIIIPYTTAMKVLFGQDYLKEIDMICENGVDLSTVTGEPATLEPWHREGFAHETPPPLNTIAGLLRKRHHIPDAEPDDFRVQNQAEIVAMASNNIWTFRVLLFSIALISLLVGGIGIMNIMIVTVTERTREIGTRKAIGAKNRDIMLQFLVEAVVMSGVGGTFGALVGIGIAKGIPKIPIFSKFSTIVQPEVVAISILVAGVVGIFFGLYPAFRAAVSTRSTPSAMSNAAPRYRFFVFLPNCSRKNIRMRRCTVRAIVILAVTAAVGGCSALDLGRQPSDYVGPGAKGPQSLTDEGLAAVTPTVRGEAVGNVEEFPATSMPGQGTSPQTMPAATQPTTTQPTASTDPSAHSGLGQGTTAAPSPNGPTPGRINVPQLLNVQDAILVGLQNNVNLRVNRYNVPIARTQEEDNARHSIPASAARSPASNPVPPKMPSAKALHATRNPSPAAAQSPSTFQPARQSARTSAPATLIIQTRPHPPAPVSASRKNSCEVLGWT